MSGCTELGLMTIFKHDAISITAVRQKEQHAVAGYNVTNNSSFNNVTQEYNSLTSTSASQSARPGLKSNIEIAYTIAASFAAFFCLLFVVFYLQGCKRRSKSKQNLAGGIASRSKSRSGLKDFLKSFSPASCTGGKTAFGLKFFTLVFIYYANVVGGERAYGKFIFAYAVEGAPQFSTDQATVLNSIFWIGFTSGRGLSGIAAIWAPPLVLVSIELAVNVICGIVLTLWGLTVPNVLWVFTGILGLFLSPAFPSCLAWCNMYVEMKGLALTVVYIGASCGAFIYQWLSGYLFEYHGPSTLMYVMLGYALTLTSTFILMVVVVRPHGKRFT